MFVDSFWYENINVSLLSSIFLKSTFFPVFIICNLCFLSLSSCVMRRFYTSLCQGTLKCENYALNSCLFLWSTNQSRAMILTDGITVYKFNNMMKWKGLKCLLTNVIKHKLGHYIGLQQKSRTWIHLDCNQVLFPFSFSLSLFSLIGIRIICIAKFSQTKTLTWSFGA